MLYWNKILKVFIPIRICWIYYNCLVNTTLNMLTLPFDPWREIFQGEIFLVMLLLSSQDFTVHQEFFYMSEISLTLVFTCIFIYLSIYFKIVWPQVLSSQAMCRSRRCYHNKEKETVTSQKPNLCLWGTWKFSPKNLRTEKIPRQLIFISIKAFNKSAVHKRKFSAELFMIQVIVIEKQS